MFLVFISNVEIQHKNQKDFLSIVLTQVAFHEHLVKLVRIWKEGGPCFKSRHTCIQPNLTGRSPLGLFFTEIKSASAVCHRRLRKSTLLALLASRQK